MAADNITLPREDVFEAAAWLLAFTELFETAEEETPSVLGDGWGPPAFGLATALAGGDLPEGDEEFESHPILVEVFAKARELAAGMVRCVISETEVEATADRRYPFTFYGDPWTLKGLGKLAARLEAEAEQTRIQGVIHPRTAEHAG
jgi:hypothetical protein